ncbi:hypothetical protein ABZP36_035477 [Zizania latifolia]
MLPDELVIENILTRVPPAAVVRLRAVCRTWRSALTSDRFVCAHRDHSRAATGDSQPEIVFFAPAAAGNAAAFYACKLAPDGSGAARELVSVDNLPVLPGGELVMPTKPYHGLTLLCKAKSSVYYVFNLSTGEHVALPPCALADNHSPYGTDCVRSSTGLGFDPVAGEHKVVRLYQDLEKRPRCEVYSLGSGGRWRPCAGQVPEHATKGLEGRPPVFVDGCFYWHMHTGRFSCVEARMFRTPELILSLSAGTEQFGWVHTPEELAPTVCHIADLDGSLCAVVDHRLTADEYELWTWSGAGASSPPSWSRRCRISLASLGWPMRDELGLGIRMLPLCSSPEGKILLATSRHKVYAYDAGSNHVDRVFSMHEFVDVPSEPGLMLNIGLHEESVTGVRHCLAGGDGGLRMMMGRSGTVAKREGRPDRHPSGFNITPGAVRWMIGLAMDHYNRYMRNN